MSKKQFRKYTAEQMAEALAATNTGKPVATAASKRFGVPRITLRNKLKVPRYVIWAHPQFFR